MIAFLLFVSGILVQQQFFSTVTRKPDRLVAERTSLANFGRPGLSSAPRDRLRTSEHADVDQLYELVSHATVKEGAQEDARRRHVAERGCGRGFRRPLEAPGGSGGAKKWPGRLALPVWWGRVGSGINPGFFKVIHCTPDRELDGCVLRVFAHDQSHQSRTSRTIVGVTPRAET